MEILQDFPSAITAIQNKMLRRVRAVAQECVKSRIIGLCATLAVYLLLESLSSPSNLSLEVIPNRWPAAGISVFFVYFYGFRNSLLIFAASFYVLMLKESIPPWIGVFLAFGEMAQALVGALLVKKYCRLDSILTRPSQLLALFSMASFAALCGATIGMFALATGGYSYPILKGFFHWLIGDLLAILVVGQTTSYLQNRRDIDQDPAPNQLYFDLLGVSLLMIVDLQFLVPLYSVGTYVWLAILILPLRFLIVLKGSQGMLTLLDIISVAIGAIGYHFELGVFSRDNAIFLPSSIQIFTLTNIFTSRLVMSQSFENKAAIRKLSQSLSAKREAQESERRSQMLLQQGICVAEIGIFDHEMVREEVYWSPEMRKIWGWKPDALVTLRSFLKYVHPEDLETVKVALQKSSDPLGDGNLKLEHRILTPKGELRWISVKSKTLFSACEGRRSPVRVVGAVIDITAVKEREATILKSQRELQNLSRDLTRKKENLERINIELRQFAAVAAHDLRSPVRATLTWVQLLAKYLPKPREAGLEEAIGFVAENAKLADTLIENLLSISNVSMDGLKDSHCVNLESLVLDILSGMKKEIAEADARLFVGHLPTVQGNPRYLETLFENLIQNAFNYREKSRSLELHLEFRETPEAYEMIVRDNGIGIDPQYCHRIFNIFTRLHGAEVPGTGVGLALCKKIVELYGGTIWVECHRGQGSSFHFTYPKTVTMGLESLSNGWIT